MNLSTDNSSSPDDSQINQGADLSSLGDLKPPKEFRLNRDSVVASINSERVILTPEGDEVALASVGCTAIAAENSCLSYLLNKSNNTDKKRRDVESLKAMRQLEIAVHEPYSDKGHMRLYPKGALMAQIIKDWQRSVLDQEMNAFEIATPYIYDWSQESLQSEAKSFADELYYVYPPDKSKEFVLRFGGDFGLFGMLSDMNITYKNLPFRLYEFSPSFRYERSGNLRGLQRARAFSFFDIHSISTQQQGYTEFKSWLENHVKHADELIPEYTVEFSVTKDFYQDNQEYVKSLVKSTGKPCIVELLSDRKHYWCVKYMFYDNHGNDYFNNQLDFVNGDHFGLGYTNNSGQQESITLCHASMGSLERWIVHGLDSALAKDKPEIPLWMNPTHVRVIPVTMEHVAKAEEFAAILKTSGVRVEVDDRDKSLGRRVRMSKEDWIPYVIVVGDKEDSQSKINVQMRDGTKVSQGLNELAHSIVKQINGKPTFRLNPERLSMRPKFI